MVRERLHDFEIEIGIKTGGRGLTLSPPPPPSHTGCNKQTGMRKARLLLYSRIQNVFTGSRHWVKKDSRCVYRSVLETNPTRSRYRYKCTYTGPIVQVSSVIADRIATRE
jgi:hypothetical protein